MKDSDKTVEVFKKKLWKKVLDDSRKESWSAIHYDELVDEFVTEVSAASRREAQEEMLGDMFKMLDALPYRQPLPKHILAIDLHQYEKVKEIKVLQKES